MSKYKVVESLNYGNRVLSVHATEDEAKAARDKHLSQGRTVRIDETRTESNGTPEQPAQPAQPS